MSGLQCSPLCLQGLCESKSLALAERRALLKSSGDPVANTALRYSGGPQSLCYYKIEQKDCRKE